jgi:hypothetical protein
MATITTTTVLAHTPVVHITNITSGDPLGDVGVAAAIAVAAFTLGTVVLTWMGYAHIRDAAGRRKPFEVKRAIWPNFEFRPKSLGHSFVAKEEERPNFRVGWLYIFNHADNEQILGLGGGSKHAFKTRLLWPHPFKTKGRLWLQALVFPPRDGGVIPLTIVSDRSWWPEDELNSGEYERPTFKRSYWFYIKGRTNANRVVRYFGRIPLLPYDAELARLKQAEPKE